MTIKKLAAAFSAVLAMTLLSVTSLAVADLPERILDDIGTESLERALPYETRSEAAVAKEQLDDSLAALWRKALEKAGSFKGEIAMTLTVLLAAVMLGSLPEHGENSLRPVMLAGTLCIALAAVKGFGSLLPGSEEAIGTLRDYSKALLAAVASAMTVAGSPMKAAASQAAAMLFSDLVISLINTLFLPLTYLYLALVTADAALGECTLNRLAKLIKWLIAGSLGLCLTAYVTYLSLTGAMAGSADTLTVKGAQLAMSGAVPVVGGIISDAAETVVAGAKVAQRSIGALGLVAVLGICLEPFVRLGLHYLLYKLAAALASPLAGGRLAGYIDSVSSAFGLILAQVGAAAMVLLISMFMAIAGAG